MGASLGETGPFACSCLPFPGPQRPIKRTLMEDDKRQPTPLLSVCASSRHSVYPPKMAHFFFSFGLIKHSSSSFSHRRSGVCRVKGRPQLLTHRAAKMNLNMCAMVWRMQYPNGNILTPKPQLSFRFISRVLKATKCNSVDGFRCAHLSHSSTSNFKGVDRKQNMYYEGLSPVN